jgi:anti-sigma B factor antagonist
MELERSFADKVAVLRVKGDVDLFQGTALKSAILEETHAENAGLIIDLGGVGYMDSSGVGILLLAKSYCEKKDIPLRIAAVQEPVRRVLELTKLSDYLPLCGSTEDALLDLAGSGGDCNEVPSEPVDDA